MYISPPLSQVALVLTSLNRGKLKESLEVELTFRDPVHYANY